MLAIFLIPTMPDLRQALYFYMVEQLYHGNYPEKWRDRDLANKVM